jgi:hypothetical protein
MALGTCDNLYVIAVSVTFVTRYVLCLYLAGSCIVTVSSSWSHTSSPWHRTARP